MGSSERYQECLEKLSDGKKFEKYFPGSRQIWEYMGGSFNMRNQYIKVYMNWSKSDWQFDLMAEKDQYLKEWPKVDRVCRILSSKYTKEEWVLLVQNKSILKDHFKWERKKREVNWSSK